MAWVKESPETQTATASSQSSSSSLSLLLGMEIEKVLDWEREMGISCLEIKKEKKLEKKREKRKKDYHSPFMQLIE